MSHLRHTSQKCSVPDDTLPSLARSLASNNLCGETGYINKSKVQGSSFEVGAKVTYEGRELTVSKAPDSDGDIRISRYAERPDGVFGYKRVA